MLEPGRTPLIGSRVVLRDWCPHDLPPYREWLRRQHEWHAWDGPYLSRPTDAQAEQMCGELRRRIGGVLYDPASWSGGRGTEGVRRHDSVVFGMLRRVWLGRRTGCSQTSNRDGVHQTTVSTRRRCPPDDGVHQGVSRR